MHNLASLLNAPVWQSGSQPLICLARYTETAETTTFVLHSATPQRFAFWPGQFLTISVEIDGQLQHRAYTISSSPSRPMSLNITVKRVADGQVSNWLHEHLHPGMALQAQPPAGAFHLPKHDLPQRILLLSAGCGITPMRSMIHWLLDTAQEIEITLIHSARHPQDVIFHDELQQLAQLHPHFHLAWCLSQSEPQGPYDHPRLSEAQFTELVPDLSATHVYLCGSAAYMQAIQTWLQARNFAMPNLFQEDFIPPSPSVAQTSTAATRYALEVPDFAHSSSIAAGEPLLAALEAAGLPIIGACRSGVCGACKCRVTEGTVKSTSQMGLTAEEMANGYVLACSSQATSDIKIALQ